MFGKLDMTYCSNVSCPFKDCERHWEHIKELAKQGEKYVSLADFSGTCREYISYVLDKLENEKC